MSTVARLMLSYLNPLEICARFAPINRSCNTISKHPTLWRTLNLAAALAGWTNAPTTRRAFARAIARAAPHVSAIVADGCVFDFQCLHAVDVGQLRILSLVAYRSHAMYRTLDGQGLQGGLIDAFGDLAILYRKASDSEKTSLRTCNVLLDGNTLNQHRDELLAAVDVCHGAITINGLQCVRIVRTGGNPWALDDENYRPVFTGACRIAGCERIGAGVVLGRGIVACDTCPLIFCAEDKDDCPEQGGRPCSACSRVCCRACDAKTAWSRSCSKPGCKNLLCHWCQNLGFAGECHLCPFALCGKCKGLWRCTGCNNWTCEKCMHIGALCTTCDAKAQIKQAKAEKRAMRTAWRDLDVGKRRLDAAAAMATAAATETKRSSTTATR